LTVNWQTQIQIINKKWEEQKMHTKTSRKIITFALALILALGIFANTALAAYTASEWAKPELETAQSYGLIPDVLKDADLTKPITRAEFAAVAVKAYENFTGTTVSPVASNPFTDTSNTDVLKAYNINIVNGTSATTYSPNGILTRQDAATMLTRVEKKAYISGWTLATDSNYTLNFTQPTKFADDGNISGYAKSSVYFMNAKGVINGIGNNMFSPTVTASRQEALIIAARMVDNLKGKTLDYSGGTTQPPPTQPPSGDAAKIVGSWCRLYRFNMSGREGSSSCRAYASVYIFNADGTFTCFYTNLSGTIVGGQPSFRSGRELYRKGNYTVSGNTLTLTGVVEYHTDLDVNDGTKWRAIGTREGALESLRQIPTSGYNTSIPNATYDLNFIETNIVAIGEYDTNDKTNVYQKNWEDEYKYYESQH